uniref:Uncharacterized protein n=1 Tax=Solanum tuberosum TaxID=4113 RepID=M1BXV6_SOLTU
MKYIVGLDFGVSSKQELASLMIKSKTSFTLSSGYGRRSSSKSLNCSTLSLVDEFASTVMYSPRCFPFDYLQC